MESVVPPKDNYIPLNPLVMWSRIMELRDPRTANWTIIKEPKYMVLTIVLYLYVIKVAGPRFMADRKPFNLRRVIQLYNAFQVLANLYFCVVLFYHCYVAGGYSFFCQGLSYATDYHSIEMLNNLYYYFMVRLADFFDTFFFVLKKKFSHITSLHVIHHTICVVSGWQFMKFGIGGQVMLGVSLNALVHVVMYSYYFLSSLGPEVQRHLWWKRYLTRLQIVQFFIMIGHTSIPMVVECGYPRILMALVIPQVCLILGLFVNFYVQSYIKRARDAAALQRRQAIGDSSSTDDALYRRGKARPSERCHTSASGGDATDLMGSTVTKAKTV